MGPRLRAPERGAARNIIRDFFGNLIEWYDGNTYAAFSIYFSSTFFPKGDQTARRLTIAAVFAVGFLPRLVGGMAARSVRQLVRTASCARGLGDVHSRIGTEQCVCC